MRAVAVAMIAACCAACWSAPAPAVALRNEAEGSALDDRLAALAVDDTAFYRPVLYSWTTPESVASLRASHVLLVATASSGSFTSPYHRAIDALASSGNDVARILRDDPLLARCRYAWPAPYATVRGLGTYSYGTALIRIELDPAAWIGRFDPEAQEPFTFVDVTGAIVPTAIVVAHPERIGAMFHVHVGFGVRFREYVVCNPATIAAWSIATPEIRAEVDADVKLVTALRDRSWSRVELASPAAAMWSGAAAPASTLARWHATLAFDTPTYRPAPATLAKLAAALTAYDPAGDALVVSPAPKP